MSDEDNPQIDCILCLLKTTQEHIVAIDYDPKVGCILSLLHIVLQQWWVPGVPARGQGAARQVPDLLWTSLTRCSTSGTRPPTGRGTSPGSPTSEWIRIVYKMMDQNVLEYYPNISEYNKILQNIKYHKISEIYRNVPEWTRIYILFQIGSFVAFLA